MIKIYDIIINTIFFNCFQLSKKFITFHIFFKGEPDCWIFIQGLNWLQPSLATSPVLSENEDYLCHLPARITSKKDMLWLYKRLSSFFVINIYIA